MKKACVIGWPIMHSRSPLIHGYWLERYGIDGEYAREAVQPEHFPQYLKSLASFGYCGANITAPHKEAAYQAADKRDAAAEAAGAVNTVWIENGALCATNTDTHGFLANLDEQAPGWDGGKGVAAVLGAGGAARAVIRGLLDRGFETVRLMNRTRSRAQELADRFGRGVVVTGWELRSEALHGCEALINTTALGMTGQPSLDLDLASLPPYAVVNDIVYSPLETSLLRAARAKGLRIADGLGMLLHQAAPGFARWFGLYPAVTPELRALIIADLAKVA